MIVNILNSIDNYLYFPILIIVLAASGLYFSLRTRFVQVRLFPHAWKLLNEKPSDKEAISSFQALMVSTASRVGTGNIIGVSTAICLGGPGSLFWMWLLAILGSASAYIETVLSQIYKKKEADSAACYGGPEHYIENAIGSKTLAIIFTVFLMLTYGFGFNLLCSYNVQSTFAIYDFYDPSKTPAIVGAILALIVLFCLLGGGKRIAQISEVIVPVMGLIYILVSVAIILINYKNIPDMFIRIFSDAFDFKSIFGGVSGSCMIYGIKRGLYSNEAGVGSAPHAAASADISHPVKQGLVAVISVSIDTLFLCTSTGLLCLVTDIPATEEVSGALYVQQALSTLFKGFGPLFLTIAMVLFAFTTLIGNLYYVDIGLKYLNHNKTPRKAFMIVFRILCAAVIFIGAIAPMDACWALADITMGGMALINIPVIIILGNTALKASKDYEKQLKEGKDPVFHASSIGLDDSELDYWQ